eukprot:362353-Prymnesium_polylepis.2
MIVLAAARCTAPLLRARGIDSARRSRDGHAETRMMAVQANVCVLLSDVAHVRHLPVSFQLLIRRCDPGRIDVGMIDVGMTDWICSVSEGLLRSGSRASGAAVGTLAMGLSSMFLCVCTGTLDVRTLDVRAMAAVAVASESIGGANSVGATFKSAGAVSYCSRAFSTSKVTSTATFANRSLTRAVFASTRAKPFLVASLRLLSFAPNSQACSCTRCTCRASMDMDTRKHRTRLHTHPRIAAQRAAQSACTHAWATEDVRVTI